MRRRGGRRAHRPEASTWGRERWRRTDEAVQMYVTERRGGGRERGCV